MLYVSMPEVIITMILISKSWQLKYETIVSPTVIPFNGYMEYKEILPYYRNIQKEILIDSSYKDSIGRSYYTLFTAVGALFAMAGQYAISS